MRQQKTFQQVPTQTFQRSGSMLVLGTSGRWVRVLTLPEQCGGRNLHKYWEDCFGDFDGENDEVVVWWPWEFENPRAPSHN